MSGEGRVTVQYFIPFVINWIFGDRKSGWIPVFARESQEERIKTAMDHLEKFVRARTDPGSFLHLVPVQDLNIGHLMLSTIDEIFDYAHVRGLKLFWKNNIELDENERFTQTTEG